MNTDSHLPKDNSPVPSRTNKDNPVAMVAVAVLRTKKRNVAGMQKLLLHSDQDTVVNSKGYLDIWRIKN